MVRLGPGVTRILTATLCLCGALTALASPVVMASTPTVRMAPVITPTSTSVACSPSTVVLGRSTTCTATVTDTGGPPRSAPTGIVRFQTSAATTPSCGLAPTGGGSARCSIIVVARHFPGGIYAYYGGDPTHARSRGATTLRLLPAPGRLNVRCAPGSVAVGQTTTCAASGSHLGTVTFAGNSDGTISVFGCIQTGGGGERCSAGYTPHAVGSGVHTIYAASSGDGVRTGPARSSTTVAVSQLTVTCSPSSVPVAQAATCTATAAAAVSPVGTVDFATNSSGTFNTNTCTLASIGAHAAACSVTYTPAGVGSGSHRIYVSYLGTRAATTLGVSAGPRTAAVACSPTKVGVGRSTTCVVTVSGAGHPSGMVTFASNGSGAFHPAVCSLALIGGNQARCSVTYVPSAVGSGAHKVYASYLGDAGNPPSHDSTTVSVTP